MESQQLLEVATHISATATMSRALKAQGVVDAVHAVNAMYTMHAAHGGKRHPDNSSRRGSTATA